MGKLIEKEGRFYKECGVVMLETDKHSPVALEEVRRLKFIGTMDDGYIPTNYQKTQHLYITSDEQPQLGEWCYSTRGIVGKFGEFENSYPNECKQIIATTDTSLQDTCFMCNGMKSYLKNICSECEGEGVLNNLPSSSEKFIQAYIDAYNNGNKIEKVLVEYEEIIVQDAFKRRPDYNTHRIKLKDNNIIIKKVKDSWTREEVHSLMMEAWIRGEADKSMDYTVREKWIEENL